METLLRQSRGVCPFLHKTSPATLRSLSTSTSSSLVQRSSRSGLSNLQVLANRCPIMGKALAVQSARVRVNSLLSGAFGGSRAYHSRVSRACLYTTKPKAVEHAPLRKEDGKIRSFFALPSLARALSSFLLTQPQCLILPLRLLWEAWLASTMTPFTRMSWIRSTRINPTATLTTSTA